MYLGLDLVKFRLTALVLGEDQALMTQATAPTSRNAAWPDGSDVPNNTKPLVGGG